MPSEVLRFHGIIKNDTLLECIDTTLVDDISSNRFVFKKMKGSGFLEGRIDGCARLICTQIKINHHRYLVPFEVIWDHNFKDARCSKKNVRNSYIERNRETIIEQVEQGNIIPIGEKNGNLLNIEEDDEHAVTRIRKYGEFIHLSREQEDVLSTRYPLVLSGAPGTGKTLVILAMMLKLAVSESVDLPPARLLYVANSGRLANEAQKLWLEMSGGVVEADASFLNTSAGASECLNDFSEWWEQFKQTKKNSFMKTHSFLNKVELASLYHEFRIISAYSKEEYTRLGKHQSMVIKENREPFYQLFEYYKTSSRYAANPDFVITGINGKYDLIVVDESQNLSLTVCQQLVSAATNRNICFCVDSRQDLNGFDSYIRPFLVEKIGANHHRLGVSHRNSVAISLLANRLVSAVSEREGGRDDKYDYSSIIPVDSNGLGSVTWYSYSLKSQELKNLLINARDNVTVVITNQELIDTYAGDDSLKGLVLLLPIHVIGMEFDDVLLINPLSNFGETLEPSGETKIHCTKKEWKGLSVADRCVLNQFHIMLTRAKKDLIINQSFNPKLSAFVDYLKDNAAPSCTSSSSSSSSHPVEEISTVSKKEKAEAVAKELQLIGFFKQAKELQSQHGIIADSTPVGDALTPEQIAALCHTFIESLKTANKKPLASPASNKPPQRKGKGKPNSQDKNTAIAPKVSEAETCVALFFDRKDIKHHWLAILFSPILIDGLMSCLFSHLMNHYRREYLSYFKGDKLQTLIRVLQAFGIGQSLINSEKAYPSPLWWLSQSSDTLNLLDTIMSNKKSRDALYQSITYEQLAARFVMNEDGDLSLCVMDKWYEDNRGLSLFHQWINQGNYLANASEGYKLLLDVMCVSGCQLSRETEQLKQVLLPWLINNLVSGLFTQDIFMVLKADNDAWLTVNNLFASPKEDSRFKKVLLHALCECIPLLTEGNIPCYEELLRQLLNMIQKKGSSSEVFSKAVSSLRRHFPLLETTTSSSSSATAPNPILTDKKKPVAKKIPQIPINKAYYDAQNAFITGDLKKVEAFISQTTNINQVFSNAWTPLIMASKNGDIKVMKRLLAHPNIEVNLQAGNKCTALMIAVHDCRLEAIKLLLAHPGINVNLAATSKETALIIAVYSRELEVIKLLLAHPDTDVNVTANTGESALIGATHNDHLEAIELLLAHPKINVNLQSNNGSTALIRAVDKGHFKAVERLLKHPAIDVNLKFNNDHSALMFAAHKGYTKAVVQLLAAPEIDVNLQSKGGYTALILAVEMGHFDVINLLLEKNADINLQRNGGLTALILAANSGSVDLVKLLLDKKPIINQRKNDGATALMLAANEGHVDVIKLLLENNADTNLQENDGGTALMIAAHRGHVEVIKLLLENNADINLKDNFGETALISAVNKGHVEVIELLLENNADINLKDNYGKTALDIAEDNNYQDIVNILRSHTPTETTRLGL